MRAMRRRPVCALLAVLLALQTVIFAPLAMRMAQDASPCEHMSSVPDMAPDCPCCPEGATSMGACFNVCMVQASVASDPVAAMFELTATAPAFDAAPFRGLTHLPPVPPPIA